MERNEILEIMKDFYDNNNLKLPEPVGINAGENGDICKLTLCAKCVKEKNMQEDCNAFEGWSIAVYAALKEQYQICLCIRNESDIKSGETSLHWARFLYRVERFAKQYEWFHPCDELKAEIEATKKQKGTYINNFPKKEAGEKGQHNKENLVEAYLAEGTNLKKVIQNDEIFDGENVYRQFPVGLFKDSVAKANRVFPGSKSAIDLWSYNNETFYVIELKTSNPMIGIITEIFFYTNYMCDLLIEPAVFTLNKDVKNAGRGYMNLLNHTFSNVKGIMLADKYHPILENDEVLRVLKQNQNDHIFYDKEYYNYNLEVLPKSFSMQSYT